MLKTISGRRLLYRANHARCCSLCTRLFRADLAHSGRGHNQTPARISQRMIASAEAAASDTRPDPIAEPSQEDLIQKLDIRVGKIMNISQHEEADELFVEQIDVGEIEPRTIISGLRKYCKAEDLEGRSVLVLCNLPPRKMRGIPSAGMLLCASNADHTAVEPLRPPEGAQPGERVHFGDELASPLEPATPNQVKKKKIWESCQPYLKTDEQCVPNFKGLPMLTSAGPIQSTMSQALIS